MVYKRRLTRLTRLRRLTRFTRLTRLTRVMRLTRKDFRRTYESFLGTLRNLTTIVSLGEKASF